MSTAVLNKHLADAHEVGHDHDHAHDSGGNTVFGFWLYLMTDCVLFASVFATYAVLVHHTAGGQRQGHLRTALRAGGNRHPAGFQLHLRPGHALCAQGRQGPGDRLARGHLPARRRVHWDGDQRVPPPDRRRFRPEPQRLPVVLLHPGRHARPARQRRSAVDAGADGADLDPRPHRAEQHPDDVPEPVLALPRHRLDLRLHRRLPDGAL